MKKILVLLAVILSIYTAGAQDRKTQNVVIVTLDGFRWQEVFKGIDTAIMNNKEFTKDQDYVKEFWNDNPAEARKKLLPFIWSTIATKGQLYGNRTIGNNVNNANPYWFSYPGYNEIFTGYPDTLVNSNDKIKNKNTNVFEVINKQAAYKGKIAAFTSWDVFPFILNKWRNGIYVNSDQDSIKFDNKQLKLIDDMQRLTPQPLGLRPDVFTYFAAREYLKNYKPKVLYIAFDETDDFAHAGMYDQYIKSAHAEDAMIADLWKILQSMPEYKDKTTLIITVDHGRGDKIKKQWCDHGQKVEDANQIWIAALGPDSPAMGEVGKGETLYQKQIAATIAALLGIQFKPDHGTAEKIKTIAPK